MNNPQEHKRSHVVPKWLEYQKALKNRDLIIPRSNSFEINKATNECLQNDFLEFKEVPTPELACRLMGAGIVIGDEQLTRDMAAFLARKGGVDSLSLKLADRVLNSTDIYPVLEVDARITTLRKWVSMYPKSPISWIELSRAFTIKGEDDKAKKAAQTALQLAPYDRYIVRCAVRLFLHLGKFDLAWHYVKRAVKQHFDPWIKATEINVALIAEQKTPEIKRFIPQAPSINELYHYSELIESAAYLELNAGNEKKAKKQLRLAWKNPSENVITHAEWLLRNKLPSLRREIKLDFARSHEATTWINYAGLKLDEALAAAREWELEEPYSKYPFTVGSSIACSAGKPALGAEIAKRGLLGNIHDKTIYNNLCYSLLRAGQVKETDKYIAKLRKEAATDLFCKATLGLYEFKNKNITAGRKTYFDVIEQLRQQDSPELCGKAFLNLALAEIEAQTSNAMEIAIEALDATDSIQVPDIILFRKLVLNKLELNSCQGQSPQESK